MQGSEPRQPAGDAVRQVQRASAALVGRLSPLAKVRAGSSTSERDLERALETLGDVDTFVAALGDLADQARRLVREAHARRADDLRAAVAGYLRESGRTDVRETAIGWRISRVELELKPDTGEIRGLYNREPLTEWLPASEPRHVHECLSRAEALLDKAAIPIDSLASSFIEACEYLESRREGLNLAPRRIALKDMLDEVRLIRARTALAAKKRRDAEAAVQMPLWALLYNADLYRASAPNLPADERLMFETGSTNETKRIGLTLNGLDPARDYQRFCYVRRTSSG